MFYFYRQIIKKWNSKLSTRVILDLWSIKVKKKWLNGLKKSTQKYWYFSYFSMKTYILGTHQKRLAEALLMSTHNICLHGEIRKILPGYPSRSSGAMNKNLEENLRVNIFSTSRSLIDDQSVLQNRWSTMEFWPIPNSTVQRTLSTTMWKEELVAILFVGLWPVYCLSWFVCSTSWCHW